MEISTTFIAKGCERRPNVLSCSRRVELIAYASSGDVCFAEISNSNETSRIIYTQMAHQQPITCLKFVKWSCEEPSDGYDYLISGCADGSVSVWKIENIHEQNSDRIQCSALAKNTSDTTGTAVTYCAGVVQTNDSKSNLFTYASVIPNGQLQIRCNRLINNPMTDDPEMMETAHITHSVSHLFILCFDFHLLAPGALIMALGCSNFTIELLSISIENKNSTKLLTLHGHADWISCLTFKNDPLERDSTVLASAGQDNLIRLWRFTNANLSKDDDEKALDDTKQERQKSVSSDSTKPNLLLQQQTEAPEFTTKPQIMNLKSDRGDTIEINVRLESILSGHDGWINSLEWHPYQNQLLSVSNDKCLILWEQSEIADGIWLEKVRVGDVGGQSVGYYGGCYTPQNDCIIAYSYFGGFYCWRSADESRGEGGDGGYLWESRPLFGGHSMAVCDVCWDPSGTYLLSCSLDQTTRCFAPYKDTDSYAEIARPQVHGYDLACLASVSPSCFVSGAEEKILRAFRAPKTFARSLANLSKCNFEKLFPDTDKLPEQGASVPALGLSNKEIGEDQGLEYGLGGNANEIASLIANPVVLEEMPTEDHLMQNTLWPEIHKLYGHGFEVFAIAVNHCGTLIATSCRASQQAHASILLWDTDQWEHRAELIHHHLTVTQLEFSHDDSMLLSVSRDRTFALYGCDSSSDAFDWGLLKASSKTDGVHSRIIWTCSWSSDDRYFATGARDKKVALWSVAANDNEEKSTHVQIALQSKRSESVTAIAFCPSLLNQSYVLAIGLENGQIELVAWNPSVGMATDLSLLASLDGCRAHSQTIARLRFRPKPGKWMSVCESEKSTNENIYELASVANDNAVKVHRIHLLN